MSNYVYNKQVMREGYRRGSRMGYMKNGKPVVRMTHRMGCWEAYVRTWRKVDRNKIIRSRMAERELIEKYPNPSDRFVMICKEYR